MKEKRFRHHKERWQNMAAVWKFYTKPSRPSREDMGNYKKMMEAALEGIVKPTVVVLGATPEVRDLLFQFSRKQGAKILCVDMTKDMYIAMSQLTRRRNPEEKFVTSNWLEMSGKMGRGRADAVIGDFVIGNVGGFEDKFLGEVARVLKPGGYFITRVYYHSRAVRRIPDYRKELKRLAGKVTSGEYTVKEAKEYFLNNTLFATWYLRKDNKISQTYAKGRYENLEKQRNTFSAVERRIFDAFWKYWWPVREKYWTNLPEKKLERTLKRNFLIRKKHFSHDYELAKILPTYLLENNS